MIATVIFNPSLDKTVMVDGLVMKLSRGAGLEEALV
jgi:hypothetical protein